MQSHLIKIALKVLSLTFPVFPDDMSHIGIIFICLVLFQCLNISCLSKYFYIILSSCNLFLVLNSCIFQVLLCILTDKVNHTIFLKILDQNVMIFKTLSSFSFGAPGSSSFRSS